ncbi:hypothetical protein [Lacipirellula sp.]|uniref:hypothetical protein n=1 Tax=Lacipirellula sp. TaxID=2691419 RepID=UPI003D14A4A6
MDGSQVNASADLELICAYAVSKDGVTVRYEQFRKNTGQTYGAGEHREYHESIVREIIEKTASWTKGGSDNLKRIKAECDYYLDAMSERFFRQPGSQREYNGLHRLQIDRRLRSISWSFSIEQEPITRASWNSEANEFVRPWEDRARVRGQRLLGAARLSSTSATRKLSTGNSGQL